MSLVSVRDIKNLLKRYKVHPLKRMGQNFLIDEEIIKKVIESAQLSKNDIVLEIGPGLGVLTQELAKRVKKVIAVEKDSKMCQILKEMLDCWNVKNVEIVNEDILKLDTRYKIQDTKYKVVGNLPFYLTAPVIRQFLEVVDVKHRASACGSEGKDEDKVLIAPQQMVLVVQKEVAQRICPPRRARSSGEAGAKPPRMNLLAVSVQFYAKPEIETFVPKKSFWPQPKVDGAIIKIIPKKLSTRPGSVDLFFKIVKAGFSQPRKQLVNNLSRGLGIEREKVKDWLSKNNVRPSQRAETLSVEDWINLLQSCRIN